MAGRGAQEVGSCLKKFLEKHLDKNITELRLWSDSCGGQNRNIKMCLMMKFILQHHPSLKMISMKFLESGHSFLPNDSDFSDIEKALKYQQRLYVPQDYINVIKTCRKKTPFKVTAMEKMDFRSTEGMEKAIINRKVNTEGNKINWLSAKEIQLRKDHPYSLFLRTCHSTEKPFEEIDLTPKQNIKKYHPFPESLELLWPEGNAISTPKLKDIQSILHLIPSSEQEFYTSLLSNDNVVDDIDGFNADVDFEFENV
ncbi:unnamed protein product [Psylliodes chrysocephalus]|uniref:DUF7869 domain-containing protein n=1 Tax=Psylliodes chrysocephalus TaxID=3402493 RepID=A0A9P0GE07_9CUCU|nr:unnamed protein product [Psylliodes chrysocephala]